jgi:AcrR family transcriptional regulator
MTTLALDTETKRGAVMKAALELISQHGFHGTSTDMIAKHAKVGMGTIYRYFSSKDVLINALYLEIKTQFSEALLEHDDETLGLKQRFKNIWIALIKQYTVHPVELRFIEQYANSPFLDHETRGRQQELSAPFTRLFEQGMNTSVFRDLPLEILRALMYGSALQLAKTHISGSLELSETLLASAFEACWNAVAK